MSLLKKPLDYTRRCDKCKNWIPSHVTEDFEGIQEGDGHYCELGGLYDHSSNEKGYSRLVQRAIYAIMSEFTMCDDMFLDDEYNSQVLITIANFCPLFDEITVEEMKERNKKYKCENNPYLTMYGVKEVNKNDIGFLLTLWG